MILKKFPLKTHDDRYSKAWFKFLIAREICLDSHRHNINKLIIPNNSSELAQYFYTFFHRFKHTIIGALDDKAINNLVNKFSNINIQNLICNKLCKIHAYNHQIDASEYYEYDSEIPKQLKNIPLKHYTSLIKFSNNSDNQCLDNIIELLYIVCVKKEVVLNFQFTDLDNVINFDYSILAKLYHNLSMLELSNSKELHNSAIKVINNKKQSNTNEINMKRKQNINKYLSSLTNHQIESYINDADDLIKSCQLLYKLVKFDFEFCKKEGYKKTYQKDDFKYYENKYSDTHGFIDFSKTPQGKWIIELKKDWFFEKLYEKIHKNI